MCLCINIVLSLPATTRQLLCYMQTNVSSVATPAYIAIYEIIDCAVKNRCNVIHCLARFIMAMHAEESAPLRRAITTGLSPCVLAAEAGGSAGEMEMAMLPGYQRLSTTCDATFPDDESGDYRACLPQAVRMLWGILTRVVWRWRGEDEESAAAPAPAARNERRRSSWRPDPDDRWPVQGWC